MFEFYKVEDVMQMLDVSRSKAYDLIREMNLELEALGKKFLPGRISKKYFEERWT